MENLKPSFKGLKYKEKTIAMLWAFYLQRGVRRKYTSQSCGGHLKRQPCMKMQGFVISWSIKTKGFGKRKEMAKPQRVSGAGLHFQERAQRKDEVNPVEVTGRKPLQTLKPCKS